LEAVSIGFLKKRIQPRARNDAANPPASKEAAFCGFHELSGAKRANLV